MPPSARWICCLLLPLLVMPAVTAAEDLPESLLAKAKAVLSQVEGELMLDGLQQPVEIRRDRWGIAHIYARNQHDLFFAQGFVAAQDRLFQIDLWRRVARGETAQIVGREGIEADRFARLVNYRGDMDAEWTSYAPDAREIAAAFTAGINACIDKVTAEDKLPIEFQLLGCQPEKWVPEDVLGRMSGIIMTSNWQREVARARLIAVVGGERARVLAPTDPPRDYAPAAGIDLNALTADIFRGYTAASRMLKFSPSMTESNNWVVDGTLSASGKPLLASDPHRGIAVPSLRYLVHLHTPGWNVIGAGEPALPGVALGHNERIAWGFTIVGTDQADLYVEETDPSDPRKYRVGDRFEPMVVLRDGIRVRGQSEPHEVELRYTRHGPVIYQDENRHLAYALKWVGSEPGGAAYLGSLSVARAKDRESFLKSLQAWKSPCENFVYADVDGHTGWVAAALTPLRRGWDGLLPVPGAAGRYEWQGFLEVKDLPQSFDPPAHWLATSNHNILPAGYQQAIAYEWAAPHRFLRVQQRLTAQDKFTLDDFRDIQHENTSLPALELAQVLKQVDLPVELVPFGKLLSQWDGVLSREARAGPLYAVWLQELRKALFAEHIPADAWLERSDLRSITVMLAQLREPGEAFFGPEAMQKRDELIRTTLAAAVARTKKLLGDDPVRWSWGRLHTVTFEHPLATLGPAHAQAFNLGPVARPGDVNTPNNTRHDDNFRQVHGASYRHVFDLADWDRGLATSTPGQSGQLGSEHYGDLLPLWAEGEYFPLAYSRAKVERVTQHVLLLQPAAAPDWVQPMRKVHARFRGTPGTLALFGDSISVSQAFWSPLRGEPRGMSAEAAAAHRRVKGYLQPQCYSEWRGPEHGNEGGMTIRWAHDNVETWLKKLNPESAVILFGSNDLRQLEADEFEEKSAAVVDRCLANGTIVLLTTLPPRSGLADKAAQFAQATRRVARAKRVPLIDYHGEILERRPEDWDGSLPQFKEVEGSEYEVPTLISRDGVHPSFPKAHQDFSAESLRKNGYQLRTYLTLLAYDEVLQSVCDVSERK